VLLFVAAFLAWFIVWNLPPKGGRWPQVRAAVAAVAAIAALALAVLEWPHRYMPALPAIAVDRLAVIGDSLSAGIETARGGPWPVEFETLTGIPVRNLSQAGAQVSDGPDLARRLMPEDRLVLVELGGNDLIAGVSTAEFERGLNATLAAILPAGDKGDSPRTVVMFELPLLPHKVGYGRVQRRLAAAYGVLLIPRRDLTAVLGAADATSDGLHLAPVGARRMAQTVAERLRPVLRSPSSPASRPLSRPAKAQTTSSGNTAQ
jgi:lysophospholipase L1-like esterase